MPDSPLNPIVGNSLTEIEYDGTNVLFKFSDNNYITVYSGLKLSFRNLGNRVKAISIEAEDHIYLDFDDFGLSISIDKDVVESFTAVVNGVNIVERGD